MICGSLKDITILKNYNLLSLENLISTAMSFYKENPDFVGRHTLKEGLVFANFDQGATENKEARRFEYHKDFLDVHIILKGAEKIGFRTSFLKDEDLVVPFDDAKDLGFLQDYHNDCDYVTLNENDFAIFAPLEIHKPLCAVDTPKPISKIVLKVHKDYLMK